MNVERAVHTSNALACIYAFFMAMMLCLLGIGYVLIGPAALLVVILAMTIWTFYCHRFCRAGGYELAVILTIAAILFAWFPAEAQTSVDNIDELVAEEFLLDSIKKEAALLSGWRAKICAVGPRSRTIFKIRAHELNYSIRSYFRAGPHKISKEAIEKLRSQLPPMVAPCP